MVPIQPRVINFTCRLTFEAGISAESPPADCRGFSIHTPASFPPKFADSVPSSQLPTHPQLRSFFPITPFPSDCLLSCVYSPPTLPPFPFTHPSPRFIATAQDWSIKSVIIFLCNCKQQLQRIKTCLQPFLGHNWVRDSLRLITAQLWCNPPWLTGLKAPTNS